MQFTKVALSQNGQILKSNLAIWSHWTGREVQKRRRNDFAEQ